MQITPLFDNEFLIIFTWVFLFMHQLTYLESCSFYFRIVISKIQLKIIQPFWKHFSCFFHNNFKFKLLWNKQEKYVQKVGNY